MRLPPGQAPRTAGAGPGAGGAGWPLASGRVARRLAAAGGVAAVLLFAARAFVCSCVRWWVRTRVSTHAETSGARRQRSPGGRGVTAWIAGRAEACARAQAHGRFVPTELPERSGAATKPAASTCAGGRQSAETPERRPLAPYPVSLARVARSRSDRGPAHATLELEAWAAHVMWSSKPGPVAAMSELEARPGVAHVMSGLAGGRACGAGARSPGRYVRPQARERAITWCRPGWSPG